MSVQIVSRRRISMVMSTGPCKACGQPFKFVDPAYVVTVRVDEHAHTPRICTGCNKHDDETLIGELIADAWRVVQVEDIFRTSYLNHMIAQDGHFNG